MSFAGLDALREALAVAWWYKPDLERFVRTCVPHSEVVARLNFGMTKREVAAELTGFLGADARYTATVVDLMRELCSLDASFPHLARLEDGQLKVVAARAAIDALRQQYEVHSGLVAERAEAAERRAEAREASETRQATGIRLEALKTKFTTMLGMDPQRRAYELQAVLRELFDLFDLDPKASFAISGEQIDGAFSFDGDDYLLEARWQQDPADPAALRDFAGKIDTKLKTTLGVFVSINGFTDAAVRNHSRRGANMFLVNGEDLYAILDGWARLPDVLVRKRRHASQTGDIYLQVRDF